jgi:hypothetical protein
MRKLLLVLFLFALTSNALAEVEIWECDGDYYKIDTDIPTVYIRQNSRWIDISNASELLDAFGENTEDEFDHLIVDYSRKDESVYWIRPDTKEYFAVMDLFTKEFFVINNGKHKLQSTCELYVR